LLAVILQPAHAEEWLLVMAAGHCWCLRVIKSLLKWLIFGRFDFFIENVRVPAVIIKLQASLHVVFLVLLHLNGGFASYYPLQQFEVLVHDAALLFFALTKCQTDDLLGR
jgi:hypothetical protein